MGFGIASRMAYPEKIHEYVFDIRIDGGPGLCPGGESSLNCNSSHNCGDDGCTDDDPEAAHCIEKVLPLGENTIREISLFAGEGAHATQLSRLTPSVILTCWGWLGFV
jgi:hypothetical protein